MSRRRQLSVVIPTLGAHEVLARVLDGYGAQDAPADSFEVVVVSDCAEPDPAGVRTAVGERAYPVRLLTGPRPGASANRNRGWQATCAPIVLFTDGDTVPRPDLITQHLAWHERFSQPEAVVLGLVRWAPALTVTPFMRWLEHGVQFDYHSISGTEASWTHVYSSNLSVKRSFLERVGGYDEERFPYGYEDLDWGYRAQAHRLRVHFNRAAVVDHWRTMTIEQWQARAPRLAASEFRFCQIHPDVLPWFHRIFAEAAALPPGGRRSAALAGLVPRATPWLGRLVWSRATLYWRQQIAPPFLAAWAAAAAGTVTEPAPGDAAAAERAGKSHPAG